VLVVTDEGCPNIKMANPLRGVTSIFRGAQIDTAQNFDRAQRHIVQMTNRGGDNIKTRWQGALSASDHLGQLRAILPR